MDTTKKILQSVPFLSHFNNEELNIFFSAGRTVTVRSGQIVDVKKTGSLNVVLNGIFEIESVGNRDVVYLSPGSFFGSMPFSEVKRKGNVKALVDSTLFIISEEDVLRFFVQSSKALRGYVKLLNRIGFEISDTGKEYFNSQMKLVTVFSSEKGAGKTFLSSVLGLSLSEYDRAVILDLSYSGKSVFDFFNQRLTAPLSEKPDNAGSAGVLIQDRLVQVNENLHLLNVSFSSRVKTDPEIIGYLLFILAKEYKYIIADLSDYDPELRDELFIRSDIIFNITNRKKPDNFMNPVFDSLLQDGQRLYSVRNNKIAGRGGDFYGGLILDSCDSYDESPHIEVLKEFSSGESVGSFNKIIVKNTRSLVFQSLEKDAVFLSGFLSELNKSGRHPDYLYSSCHSYFLTALSLLADNQNYRDVLRRFFSRENINRICAITFPEKYVFKNDRLLKYCDEIAGSKRIEMFQSLPLCRLRDSRGNERIFSTGPLAGLMAGSFVSSPLFEPVPLAGGIYDSGFPAVLATGAHLFRTESDDITFVSVTNRGKLSVDLNILELYASWLNSRSADDQVHYSDLSFYNKKLTIEVMSDEFRFDKIFEETQIRAESLLNKL